MGKTTKITIGSVQFNPLQKNGGENLERAVNYIELLVEKGVDLVLLPEMFNTGYGTDDETLQLATELYEETLETLSAIADYNDVAIIGGMIRKKTDRYFNSTVIVLPYREPIFYDKTHLFRDEKGVFSPGEKFVTFVYLDVTFGVVMCYEIGFPEISRILCKQSGAQVLLAPFAFGAERHRIYDVATRSRAMENGAFLVTSSQNGNSGKMNFIGKSRIVSPSGEIITEAGNAEGIILGKLDLGLVEKYRYREVDDSHAYYANFRNDLYK